MTRTRAIAGLAAAGATFPDYSPDGKRIAFDAGGVGCDANDEIFVVWQPHGR